MSWAADRSVTVRRVADRSGIALAPNLGADRSGMLADRTAMAIWKISLETEMKQKRPLEIELN